jgi:predicted DNA-binding antitoxin AbrB/MazE fold protein
MQGTASSPSPDGLAMPITVEAIYENGVVKPKHQLELSEGTKVRLSVTPIAENHDPLSSVTGIGGGATDGAENHDNYIYGKPWA